MLRFWPGVPDSSILRLTTTQVSCREAKLYLWWLLSHDSHLSYISYISFFLSCFNIFFHTHFFHFPYSIFSGLLFNNLLRFLPSSSFFFCTFRNLSHFPCLFSSSLLNLPPIFPSCTVYHSFLIFFFSFSESAYSFFCSLVHHGLCLWPIPSFLLSSHSFCLL